MQSDNITPHNNNLMMVTDIINHEVSIDRHLKKLNKKKKIQIFSSRFKIQDHIYLISRYKTAFVSHVATTPHLSDISLQDCIYLSCRFNTAFI